MGLREAIPFFNDLTALPPWIEAVGFVNSFLLCTPWIELQPTCTSGQFVVKATTGVLTWIRSFDSLRMTLPRRDYERHHTNHAVHNPLKSGFHRDSDFTPKGFHLPFMADFTEWLIRLCLINHSCYNSPRWVYFIVVEKPQDGNA